MQRDGTLVDVARRQLRLAYAYEPLERIRAAIGVLRDALGYARERLQ